jgi:hypothetical protein
MFGKITKILRRFHIYIKLVFELQAGGGNKPPNS